MQLLVSEIHAAVQRPINFASALVHEFTLMMWTTYSWTMARLCFALVFRCRSAYNESLAGVSLLDWNEESFDKQGLRIDPYFPNGTLLPFIDPEPLPPAGTGDDKARRAECCVEIFPLVD